MLQNNSSAVASTTTSLDNAAGTHLASSILTALSGQTLTINGNTITFNGGTTVSTVGSIVAKHAPDDAARHRKLLVFTAVALLLLLAGIPWQRPLMPGMGG